MKPFKDHIENLKIKMPDLFQGFGLDRRTCQLIYEMLQYELEGKSKFLRSINDAMQLVEIQNKPVKKIEMSFKTFEQFREERKLDVLSFLAVTEKELLKTGFYGQIWGADVYINNSLAFNEIKAYPKED